MKIVAVGDVHGRDTWKAIRDKEADFDKFVFIGDYFDNFPPMTREDIIQNFMEILLFKVQNPDTVEMLIGNHDFHYMRWLTDEKYSGYDHMNADRICDLLKLNKQFLNVAYSHEDFLFTHAGVTTEWLARIDRPSITDKELVAPFLNQLLHEAPEYFRFLQQDSSGYGEHPAQSPFWVRPKSLFHHRLMGPVQVIGHTTFDKVSSLEDEIVLLDAPKSAEYLVIEDGVARIGCLKEAVEPQDGISPTTV